MFSSFTSHVFHSHPGMAMESTYKIKPDHSAPSDGQVESEEQDDTFLFMDNAHDLDASGKL